MRLLLILGLVAGSGVWACEPARLQFEGTPFMQRPMEIEGRQIYFFRGTDHQIQFVFDLGKKLWCYARPKKVGDWPPEGCLSRLERNGKRLLQVGNKVFPHMYLRDGNGLPVANVSVLGDLLTASLVSPDGKSTGKRILFKHIPLRHDDELEVRAWNCPNSRFLSCAGAELTTSVEAPAIGTPVKVGDIGKRLGHYRASCEGLREQNDPDEREPATQQKRDLVKVPFPKSNF